PTAGATPARSAAPATGAGSAGSGSSGTTGARGHKLGIFLGSLPFRGRGDTRNDTSGAENRFLDGVVNVGVVVHGGADVGVPHEALKDMGGHSGGVAAPEAPA